MAPVKILSKFAVLFSLFATSVVAGGGSGGGGGGGDNVPSETYDYVVVGTGPGGGPIAVNLAKAGYSVAVVEAGGDNSDNIFSIVPGFSGFVSEQPDMRWDFFVDHFEDGIQQAKDWRLTYRKTDGTYYTGFNPPEGAVKLGIYYPRGSTFGGSAEINAITAAMPSDRDWSIVTEITGDQSWSPPQVYTHYEKTKTWLGLSVGDFTGLGQNSPNVKTIYEAGATVLGEDYDDVVQKDINNVNDPQRDFVEGAFPVTFHVDSRGRRSTSQTYITQTLGEKHANGTAKYKLSVKLNTLATKILFDTPRGKQPRAKGIEVLQGANAYKADPQYDASAPTTKARIYARKEVIISTGTFNTPQLLKLSGIGPRAELESFNIPVLINNPLVGTNLQDNYETAVVHNGSAGYPNAAFAQCTFTPDATLDPCFAEWEATGQGPYGVGPSMGFILKSPEAASQNNERDIFVFGGNYAFKGFWPGFTQDMSTNATTWGFAMSKLHSRSAAGTVTLRSNDPTEPPIIKFRFFQNGADKDLNVIKYGVDFGKDVMAAVPDTSPLKPFVEIEPCYGGGCSAQEDKSFIKDNAYSHHAVGTAAIGKVVDSKFRVIGTKGLRVVDASVWPRNPGAFPTLPTFVLSEKASVDVLAAAPYM